MFYSDKGKAGTHQETSPALNRRNLLGGLAATSAVLLLGSSTGTAVAAKRNSAIAATRAGDTAAATIERGGARHFNAPRLTPGARLRLPEGIKAVQVEGYFENRPRLGRTEYTWPYVQTADGSVADASIVPERGAASRMAVLSGFKQGWYEVSYVNGTTDRVTWDAKKLPYLWLWGEFGAWQEFPFMGQFFTIALEPLSHNPIS